MLISDEFLNILEERAKKASSPYCKYYIKSVLRYADKNSFYCEELNPREKCNENCIRYGNPEEADSDYLFMVSPDVTLALINEIRSLRKEILLFKHKE